MYEDYLASPEWQKKREERIKLDDFRCKRCGTAKNLRVHHIHYPDYSMLGTEPIEDLVTLCDTCHSEIHKHEYVAKEYADEIKEVLYSIRKIPRISINAVFALYAMDICKRTTRNLNPCDFNDLKILKDEFCEVLEIDPDLISECKAREITSFSRRQQIYSLLEKGCGVSEISESLGIKKEPIRKCMGTINKIIVQRINKIAKTQQERQELMKLCKWTETDEASGFTKLPVGGYVMKIVDVTDNERGEYIEIVWDIAEGEYANHYANEEPWRHTKRRYYRESTAPFFKAFLNRLEESNKSFSIEEWQKNCDPRNFIGLTFGGVVQERRYTNNQGDDKTVLELTDKFYAAQDIRNGDFKIPEPRDDRKKIEPAASKQAEDYADEIPF